MRRPVIVPALALVLVVVLGGCQQLFTTSLGESLTRDDPPTPKIASLDDLQELYDKLMANPDVAAACMADIVDLANDTTDPATKAAIQELAVSLAIEASGAGEAMNHLVDLLETPNQAEAAAILATIALDADLLDALRFADDAGVTPTGSEQLLAGGLLALADLRANSIDISDSGAVSAYYPSLPADATGLIDAGLAALSGSDLATTFAGFLGK